jgi:hypothetical protein
MVSGIGDATLLPKHGLPAMREDQDKELVVLALLSFSLRISTVPSGCCK